MLTGNPPYLRRELATKAGYRRGIARGKVLFQMVGAATAVLRYRNMVPGETTVNVCMGVVFP